MNNALAFLLGAAVGGAAAGVAAWRFAEERARRYGRFFSFAMHELNTPVTAVNMTVINLLSGVFGEVPPDQLKWIELTRDQIGRLNSLVGEIRDLVHMELHRDLRSTVGDAAPAEIVEEALTTLRRGFEHASVPLKVALDESLPLIHSDSDRAVRSLGSMLFHARKFRVDGPVHLRATKRGDGVAFEVEYTGQRLPPREVRASLHLLYPARERKDQILAATGLGLGLVKEVLRRVGGDLDFSVDEKGRSLLTMTLPAAKGA